MAERDSYLLKRKRTIKYTALSSAALAAVALCVFTAARAGNGGRIRKLPSEEHMEAAEEQVSEYTVPDLLTKEIDTYFNLDKAAQSAEAAKEETQPATVPADAEQNKNERAVTAEESTTAPAVAATVNADKKETVKRAATPEATTSHPVIKETRPATTTAAAETAAYMNYTYCINSGKYKDYCPGKVIDKEMVGEKIGSVTVTGYWEGFGAVSGNKTQKETLSADVYYIKGVSDDVAVCLKFKDKGDALTTDHYYVVINPKADYTPVRDYCITVPETRIAEGEYVTGTTAAAGKTEKNVPTASNPYYFEQSKEAERTSKAYIPE